MDFVLYSFLCPLFTRKYCTISSFRMWDVHQGEHRRQLAAVMSVVIGRLDDHLP